MELTVTREQVVVEARTWLGTPYRHQGRLKGVGVDCAGLVIGVVKELGLPGLDYETGYPRRPDGTLLDFVRKQTVAVPHGKQDAGDIAVMHWDNVPMHLGLMTSANTLIHSYALNRAVVEHGLDDKWFAHVTAFFRIPGVS